MRYNETVDTRNHMTMTFISAACWQTITQMDQADPVLADLQPQIPPRTYARDPSLLQITASDVDISIKTTLPTFFRTLALILVYGGSATALAVVIYKVRYPLDQRSAY